MTVLAPEDHHHVLGRATLHRRGQTRPATCRVDHGERDRVSADQELLGYDHGQVRLPHPLASQDRAGVGHVVGHGDLELPGRVDDHLLSLRDLGAIVASHVRVALRGGFLLTPTLTSTILIVDSHVYAIWQREARQELDDRLTVLPHIPLAQSQLAALFVEREAVVDEVEHRLHPLALSHPGVELGQTVEVPVAHPVVEAILPQLRWVAAVEPVGRSPLVDG